MKTLILVKLSHVIVNEVYLVKPFYSDVQQFEPWLLECPNWEIRSGLEKLGYTIF